MDSDHFGSVNDIINTAVEALEKDPKRTFTYAEMAWFKMWWNNQGPEKRESVKNLILEGRLNIVNGGWSAPDESAPGYDDLLDNYMGGHRFLEEEIGVTHPRISW